MCIRAGEGDVVDALALALLSAKAPADVARYLADAKKAAGTDLREEYQSLCEPTPAMIAVRKDRTQGIMEPAHPFDNLYYAGKNFVAGIRANF